VRLNLRARQKGLVSRAILDNPNIMMLLFAVTAVEKMKTLPPGVWLKIGIAIASLIIAVFVLRKVLRMNKIIAGVIVFVVCTVVFFSWVYNRNEPKFLTPLMDRLAPFFPSAGSYGAKQQTTPKP
jgi:glucan phosphoethanolaminetransferase (alkaline phosphatase superfamily)